MKNNSVREIRQVGSEEKGWRYGSEGETKGEDYLQGAQQGAFEETNSHLFGVKRGAISIIISYLITPSVTQRHSVGPEWQSVPALSETLIEHVSQSLKDITQVEDSGLSFHRALCCIHCLL